MCLLSWLRPLSCSQQQTPLSALGLTFRLGLHTGKPPLGMSRERAGTGEHPEVSEHSQLCTGQHKTERSIKCLKTGEKAELLSVGLQRQDGSLNISLPPLYAKENFQIYMCKLCLVCHLM